MSRRNRLSGNDPFGGSQKDNDRPTLADVDAELFGDLARVDTGRIEVRPIPIHDIYPDPTQPRRVLPSAVRGQWDGTPPTLDNVFGLWVQFVQEERGTPFDLDRMLTLREADIDDGERAVGPLEAALLEVVQLAASIRQDGLTNPITVIRDGRTYRLETGERRWLAYNLLYIHAADDEQRKVWQRIPARIMESFDVWRQAAENSARANLNAVARARQFAVLLMDLYRQQGHEFQAFEDFLNSGLPEQNYYAQVGDLQAPYGQSEILLNAMGVKHRNAISRYRNLLKLPPEVWQLADDLNWTERQLRPLTPPTPPKVSIEKAMQMAGMSPTGDNSKKAINHFDQWHNKGVKKLERDLKKMKRHEREALLDKLETLLRVYRP